MKLLFILFYSFLFSQFAYSKETCIKNDKGIFCGVEVIVEEKKLEKPEAKKECVEFNGNKICGSVCKKTIFGADCKKEKNEKCIENIKVVICGFNCKETVSASACASKPYYACIIDFDEAKCGTGCKVRYGELECDEEDPSAKYLR